MFLGQLGCTGCLECGDCGMGQMIQVPGVSPAVQSYVIYGALALVVFGVGFYIWSRQ